MGREIRMVPPNWQHPKNDKGEFLPMYDHDFDTEITRWYDEYLLWKKGEHPAQLRSDHELDYPFWEYDCPPDPDTCRPAFMEPATWYQVYETVSEGSPITPPFATQGELIQYLEDNGDFWGYKWSLERARSFVMSGYAPSMIIHNDADGVKVWKPNDDNYPT